MCLGALRGEHSLKVAHNAGAVQAFPLTQELELIIPRKHNKWPPICDAKAPTTAFGQHSMVPSFYTCNRYFIEDKYPPPPYKLRPCGAVSVNDLWRRLRRRIDDYARFESVGLSVGTCRWTFHRSWISYALVQATVGVGTVIIVYVILIMYEM